MDKAPIQFNSSAEIKTYQEAQLIDLLSYLNKHSKFYQGHFKENNIDINEIKTLEQLNKIPPVSKSDLQQYNDEFICVSRTEIIDYITTSGTLGDPVTFAMTDKDLERLATNEYFSFLTAGGSKEDIYQLMTTIDRRFMAGLAYFLGARKLGAGIVRVGSGLPELQWDTINRIAPNAIIAVPSFILRLIAYAEANGIDYKKSSVKKAICIGEPLRNPDFSLNTLGKAITDKWDIELFSTYASTEMATAFTECSAGQGGHHQPELIIVEFLDEQGREVPEGEPGEVTITTLGMEAMPLLRFQTGDICYRHSERCSCGRLSQRLGPIIGRKQHMIKYKGTTLYPPAIYDILNNDNNILNYIVEVYTNDIGTDEILIKIASKETGKEFAKRLRDTFRAKLRVTPKFEFHDSKVIQKQMFPEMSRKPIKFFDNRRNKITQYM